ncbi:hypothetical protein HK101_011430, partial [Irineochytrium annulatum]
MQEQDLSAVLSDSQDAGMAEYQVEPSNGAPGVRPASPSKDLAPGTEDAGAAPAPAVGGGGGATEGHYRRAKSPPSYSSSSARMRTPYERPPAETSYRSSGGDGGDYPGGGSGYRGSGGDGDGAGHSKYSAGKRSDSRPSRRECRVYVGNLAYEVGWQDLKDFMRKAGEVVFADILTQSGGRSKGCGVVEFETAEEAQRAIKDLNDTPFQGRPVFVREVERP